MTSSSTQQPVIEAVGLRKQFGAVTALDGLDLVAPAGVVTAVLGPNGAGKTTFVRSVATLSAPDAARCTWPASTPSPSPRRSAGSSGWPGRRRPSSRR